MTDPSIKVSPRERLVLLALTDKELYGLQIPKAMEAIGGNHRQVSIGALYPTLYSLESKRLVVSRWGEETAARGGARRRYYKLTEAGFEILKADQL